MEGNEIVMYTKADHTFVICAYKENQYLEECIRSLLKQSRKEQIIVVTSTPNDFIDGVANKYQLVLLIKEEESNIAGDFNFAYQSAETELVTIVHQDDKYHGDFLNYSLRTINRANNPLICFTNHYEIKGNQVVKNNKILRVKRCMLAPLQNELLWNSKLARRMILSFGNPISCPSVTFVKKNLPVTIFSKGYQSNVDWQAWMKLAERKGAFAYCTKPLLCHRVYSESTTTSLINQEIRSQEDYDMFCNFWPKWVAKLIMKLYMSGQNSNFE